MPAQYPGIGFPPDSAVGLLRKITNNLALIAAGGGGGGGAVTAILAGAGINVDQPTGNVTISATGGATAGYDTVTNNAGDTIITPNKSLYDIGITITGAARTSNFAILTAGRTAGDRVRLLFALPATSGIVLIPRNNATNGALLLPADIYTSPSQGYTTNGFDLSAAMEFEYTGSAWRFVTSNIPA